MGNVEVKIPMVMREDTGNASKVVVSGSDLETCLSDLVAQYPRLERRLFTPQRTVHPFVKIFVNDQDVSRDHLSEALISPGDQIHVFSAVAGG